MATNWKSVDIQCPFYITDKPQAISCEGIICKRCTHFFRNARLKGKYVNKFCIEDYKKCKYFISLMQNKYKE